MKLLWWLQKLVLGQRETVYKDDGVRFDPGKYSPFTQHRDIVFVPAVRDWGTVVMIALMTDKGPILFRANQFGQWEELIYTALDMDREEQKFVNRFLASWEETDNPTA